MEKRLLLVGVVLSTLALVVLLVITTREAVNPISQTAALKVATYDLPEHPLNAVAYDEVRSKIEVERNALWKTYSLAVTTSEKEFLTNQARELLVRSTYVNIFPYWYGTKWDFYGTTETPGQGKIACGYFVTTVLRDLGMKVQRTRLAQQASENIILSLTTNNHTKRFRQVPIEKFVDAVTKWGPGLYVVGLDVHVGFILNVEGSVYFIHSSYIEPYRVIKERAVDSTILAASRYRVLGKISEDDALVLKWLRGDHFVSKLKPELIERNTRPV